MAQYLWHMQNSTRCWRGLFWGGRCPGVSEAGLKGVGVWQARMSGVSLPPGMSPAMLKQASEMMSHMSPQDLDTLAAQAGSAGFPASPPAVPAGSGVPSSAAAGPAPAGAPGAAATPAGPAASSQPMPPASAAAGFQQAASMLQVSLGYPHVTCLTNTGCVPLEACNFQMVMYI